jgi:O-antigen biosynthesis protein WbqV
MIKNLFFNRSYRSFIAAFHDAAMAALSFLLAIYIRIGDEQIWDKIYYVKFGTLIFTIVCISVFISMRLYRGLWRYASMRDLIAIVKAVSLAVLIFAALVFIFNRSEGFPRSVLFINWMLLLAMLGGPRFAYRAFKDKTLTWNFTLNEVYKIPVLLVGAGDTAEQFIRSGQRDREAPYEVVGIVDDDVNQKNRTIHRVPIYGGREIIPTIIRKLDRKAKKPQKIIVSDEVFSGETMRELLTVADEFGIPLARLPHANELKQGIAEKIEVRSIAVEDLLGRSQHALDRKSMRELVEGRRVLVTGAGGTIGGELARQIASYNPSQLTILELSEFHLYNIERELIGKYPNLQLDCSLCDVRDTIHVNQEFAKHSPELVFHAAAIKHVPIAEYNIEETILTNVFGTKNIAEACLANNIRAMVMISTDKAVNPTNVMGASKRLAESFCQALGREEKKKITKFITVRFGNVLGSTGSVVPLFQEQLARGGPITVTDPEMTRYFMTVREAVELVLQASVLGLAMAEKQEYIFVLDMGKPMKILDLAINMIKLAGLKPYEDIEIKFTGLRVGEKLYEELFHDSEDFGKTANPSIFLAAPRESDFITLRNKFVELYEACTTRKEREALELLKTLVPEFTARQ